MEMEELPDWLKDWQIRLDYAVIKNAEKEGKIYDIDRLFWNGNKLFGIETFYKNIRGFELGPFFTVMVEGEEYNIEFHFDWAGCVLVLSCSDFNPYIVEPVRAQITITFDQLFGLNPAAMKIMLADSVKRLITKIEKLKNDGNK